MLALITSSAPSTCPMISAVFGVLGVRGGAGSIVNLALASAFALALALALASASLSFASSLSLSLSRFCGL